MARTLAQLLKVIRIQLQEPTAGFWTDAELTDYLNTAKSLVAEEAGLWTATVINTVAGQQAYLLPNDFRQLRRVTDDQGRDIDERQWTPDTTSKGKPDSFWLQGGKLYLYPTPDAAYVVGLEYVQEPTPFDATVTTATSGLPAGYDDFLIDYATFLGKQKDDDPAAAQYLAEANALRAARADRTFNEQPWPVATIWGDDHAES